MKITKTVEFDINELSGRDSQMSDRRGWINDSLWEKEKLSDQVGGETGFMRLNDEVKKEENMISPEKSPDNKKTMDIQRLRNLTTGKMHTNINNIKDDITFFVGRGVDSTFLLSRVNDRLIPHLREKLKDEKFWNGKYDPEHTGTIEVSPLTSDEQMILIANITPDSKQSITFAKDDNEDNISEESSVKPA